MPKSCPGGDSSPYSKLCLLLQCFPSGNKGVRAHFYTTASTIATLLQERLCASKMAARIPDMENKIQVCLRQSRGQRLDCSGDSTASTHLSRRDLAAFEGIHDSEGIPRCC